MDTQRRTENAPYSDDHHLYEHDRHHHRGRRQHRHRFRVIVIIIITIAGPGLSWIINHQWFISNHHEPRGISHCWMRWTLHLPLGLWLWKHQCDEGSAHHRVLEWPGARHKVDSMHGTLMYVAFSHADVSWNWPTRSAGDMPFKEDAGTFKSWKSFHESFIHTVWEKMYKHIICAIDSIDVIIQNMFAVSNIGNMHMILLLYVL